MPGIVFPQPQRAQYPAESQDYAGAELAQFFRNFNEARGAVLAHQTRTYALEDAIKQDFSDEAYVAALMGNIDDVYGQLSPEDQADMAGLHNALAGVKDPAQAEKLNLLFRGRMQEQRNQRRASDLARDVEQHAEDGVFGDTEGAAAVYAPILDLLSDPNQRAMLTRDDLNALESQVQDLIEREAARRDRLKQRVEYSGKATAIVDQLQGHLFPEEVKAARALATMMETAPVELMDDVWDQFIGVISGTGRKRANAQSAAIDMASNRMKFIQERLKAGDTAEEAIQTWDSVRDFIESGDGTGGGIRFDRSDEMPKAEHDEFVALMVDIALNSQDPKGDSSKLMDELKIGKLSPRDAKLIQMQVQGAQSGNQGGGGAGGGGTTPTQPEPQPQQGGQAPTSSSSASGRAAALSASGQATIGTGGQLVTPSPTTTGGGQPQTEADRRVAAERSVSQLLGKDVTLTKEQHRELRRVLKGMTSEPAPSTEKGRAAKAKWEERGARKKQQLVEAVVAKKLGSDEEIRAAVLAEIRRQKWPKWTDADVDALVDAVKRATP